MHARWISLRAGKRLLWLLWIGPLLLSGSSFVPRLRAASVNEDFTTDPLSRSWQRFGDMNLFTWNSAAGALDVTWDSSRTNSYFYLKLPTILTRHDDFSVALDLNLADIAAGVDPLKDSTFELALGFLNLDNATRTNFFRGNSALSPNLVEFDFFPDTGFGPTLWPSAWSTNSILNYNGPGDYTIMNLPVGVTMRISMTYTASNKTLSTTVTTNGISVGAISPVSLTSTFTDFRVAAFAIESYSDAGQNPLYGGSLLAHGRVDNIALTFPPPPIQDLKGSVAANHWQVTFGNRTNWLYTLERSAALQVWSGVSQSTPGNGATLSITDTNALVDSGFYRVRAEKPP